MRWIEISGSHVNLLSELIHFSQKIFRVIRMIIELVRFDPRNICMCILFSEQLFSKILRKSKCSVVTWREHQAIEKLFNSENIPSFKMRTCSSNIWRYWWDHYLGLFYIEFPLLTQLKNNITCHNFRKWRALSFVIFSLAMNKRHLVDIVDGPAFRRDLWHILEHLSFSRFHQRLFVAYCRWNFRSSKIHWGVMSMFIFDLFILN